MNKFIASSRKLINKVINEYKNNKATKYLILLGILLLIAFFGFSIGKGSTSKNYMINKFQRAVDNNDTRGMLKYISVKDDEIPLSKENLQSFLDYLNAAEGRKTQFISYLKSKEALQGNRMATIKELDKGIFKKWVIELQPVYLQLTTAYGETELYINGISYGKSTEENFQFTVGPLLPGKYSLKVKLSNEFGESEADKSVILLEGTIPTSLTPPAKYLTLLSNFPEAEVFINDKSSDLTIKEFKKVGPVPIKSDIKLYSQMEFPWGIIKSPEKQVEDSSSIRLDINPLNDTIKEQLELNYRDFYQELFEALNNQDLTLISEPSRDAAGKIYNRYKSTALIVKDSYEITDIDWEESVVALKRENDSYISNALVTLEYNKNKTLWGFPISSKPVKLSFQTFLTYDSNSDSWYVSTINDLSSNK